jgi:hypothetical protein
MKRQQWRDLVTPEARGLLMNATRHCYAAGMCEGKGESSTGKVIRDAFALADSADEALYRYVAALEAKVNV